MLGSNPSFHHSITPEIYFGSLSTGCRRWDRYTTNTGFLDRPGNQPRGFYVVDEFAQVPSSRVAAFGNTEGLLNRHEPAVEHPRSGELRRRLQRDVVSRRRRRPLCP